MENQHIEFKQAWRDEYIKTLVGFANAGGGTLIVGKNDNGVAVGIDNAKELLEILPNKIMQRIGIFPDVNLISENNLNLLEISVSSFRVPISLNGKYYVRKGSTTQELTDKDLNRFLLSRNNETWENMIEENATFDDINNETIEKFKRLAKNHIKGVESENTETILKKLRLTDSKNRLKRAAILLFGKDPQQFFLSSYFKIGKFNSPVDLISDNVVEGNLFQQLEDVMDLLQTKYLMRRVTGYENWQRKEALDYPENALREAIINALIHKDYSGSHTQMKIFPDSIWLWNSGGLLEGLTVQKLKTVHESVLRNELICNTFYKSGFIEAWGRGTLNIVNECVAYGLPEPTYNTNEYSFEISFYPAKTVINEIDYNLNERQLIALDYVQKNGAITNKIYQNICNITKPTATRDLKELTDKNILIKIGSRGQGTEYRFPENIIGSQLAHNWLTIGS